jgi:hypothetical protein
VRHQLLLLALDTGPFSCADCRADLPTCRPADLPTAVTCVAEHGALTARAESQADRAGRRLADLVVTGTTSRWD